MKLSISHKGMDFIQTIHDKRKIDPRKKIVSFTPQIKRQRHPNIPSGKSVSRMGSLLTSTINELTQLASRPKKLPKANSYNHFRNTLSSLFSKERNRYMVKKLEEIKGKAQKKKKDFKTLVKKRNLSGQFSLRKMRPKNSISSSPMSFRHRKNASSVNLPSLNIFNDSKLKLHTIDTDSIIEEYHCPRILHETGFSEEIKKLNDLKKIKIEHKKKKKFFQNVRKKIDHIMEEREVERKNDIDTKAIAEFKKAKELNKAFLDKVQQHEKMKARGRYVRRQLLILSENQQKKKKKNKKLESLKERLSENIGHMRPRSKVNYAKKVSNDIFRQKQDMNTRRHVKIIKEIKTEERSNKAKSNKNGSLIMRGSLFHSRESRFQEKGKEKHKFDF